MQAPERCWAGATRSLMTASRTTSSTDSMPTRLPGPRTGAGAQRDRRERHIQLGSTQPRLRLHGRRKFWDVKNAVISGNWVHGNHSVGLWADTNNRGFEVENNYISDNYGYGLIYEISYNAHVEHNTFLRNGLVSGPQNKGFPTGAIYLSESGRQSCAQQVQWHFGDLGIIHLLTTGAVSSSGRIPIGSVILRRTRARVHARLSTRR